MRNLRVVYGPAAVVDVNEEAVAIGRERAPGLPTLVVRDPEVSRRHATVTYDKVEQAWCLLDAGSKNGTRVDGTRARHARLEHGSVIRAGKSVIMFTEGKVDDRTVVDLLEKAAATRALSADVAEAILVYRGLLRALG